jgi:Tfp pilus tip-associated adhesin PilY1
VSAALEALHQAAREYAAARIAHARLNDAVCEAGSAVNAARRDGRKPRGELARYRAAQNRSMVAQMCVAEAQKRLCAASMAAFPAVTDKDRAP